MANNALQKLVAEYRAEVEKAGADPVARNAAIFTYGNEVAEAARAEDMRIDHTGFEQFVTGRSSDPYDRLPRDQNATADMLWTEFGELYKGSATEQEIEAAATQVVSEHGSNWARSRLSSAKGRQEFYREVQARLGDDEAQQADVFVGRGVGSGPTHDPDNHATTEDANAAWMRELGRGRS